MDGRVPVRSDIVDDVYMRVLFQIVGDGALGAGGGGLLPGLALAREHE